MKDLTFGQYYPTNSFIHKMDARIKILMIILYITAIFFVKSYFGYAVAVLIILFLSLVSQVPMNKILSSVKRIMFIVIFTAILNVFFVKEGHYILNWWIFKITDNGLNFAIMMALRLVLLVIGTTFLTLTTTPMALTDGIESLLKPLKYIKVPIHDIAVIMSIALRFIPTLMEETNKIMNAQKARGASFDTGKMLDRAKALLPVLIPLFVSSFRRADELALALDARCYNATPKRTKMKVQKVTL
ncbi:MAG: energy-coupling factor transporter transmembrane component T, partial [Clostridia bacterium]